jgi:hypothetical protein
MTRTALQATANTIDGVDINQVGRSMAPVWFSSLLSPEGAEEL